MTTSTLGAGWDTQFPEPAILRSLTYRPGAGSRPFPMSTSLILDINGDGVSAVGLRSFGLVAAGCFMIIAPEILPPRQKSIGRESAILVLLVRGWVSFPEYEVWEVEQEGADEEDDGSSYNP